MIVPASPSDVLCCDVQTVPVSFHLCALALCTNYLSFAPSSDLSAPLTFCTICSALNFCPVAMQGRNHAILERGNVGFRQWVGGFGAEPILHLSCCIKDRAHCTSLQLALF